MQSRVLLGLLAIACAVASADRFSVRLEPFSSDPEVSSSDGAVYVSSAASLPSLTAFMRDVQADSEVPTVLFDGSLQSWMDQQLGVMDALHSLFAPRSPCGGRRSAGAFQDPSLAYMASSRFSPALLTTYLEQVDDQDPPQPEDDLEAESMDQDVTSAAWSSVFESTGAEAMDRVVRQFPEWLDAEQVQPEEDEEARRTLFAPGEPGAEASEHAGRKGDKGEHKGHKGDHKGHKEDHKDHKGEHKGHKDTWMAGQVQEGHGKPAHQHMASCRDLITFAVLLVGCVVVWGCLLRTAVRCSKMIRKNKRAARRAAVVEQNPLLAPFIREDSLEVPQMAVAAASPPTGSYYVPQGSQFVRVAYQPLSGE